MPESQQEELARLRLENARLRAAMSDENKRGLAPGVVWRGSETDFVTDLLAAIRKRAGIEDL